MKTVYEEACIENTVEKSRFIGHVRPVGSVEEAEVFIAQVKKKYWDATHNVPVYIVGTRGEQQKCSDDGEPSGTSGPPVMQMLAKEGITDIAIVITRYFGGIKLGTGGLVRAYTQTAKMALDAAGVCDIVEMDVLEIKIDYCYYDKLQNISADGLFEIDGAEFSDVIQVGLLMEKENMEAVKKLLSAHTLGSFTVLSTGFRFDKKLNNPCDQ